jgi:hypothetical protein
MPVRPESSLLFVYNDDSGPVAALRSVLHKWLAPETYPCSLCALTYGTTHMRAPWKKFVRQLKPPPRFLHRDEFLREAPPEVKEQPLPAVFRVTPGGRWETVLSATELAGFSSLEDLIAAIDSPPTGSTPPATQSGGASARTVGPSRR